MDPQDREEGSPETGRDSQSATVLWDHLLRETLLKDTGPSTISMTAMVRWGHLFRRETGEQTPPWLGMGAGEIHLRHCNSKGKFQSCP